MLNSIEINDTAKRQRALNTDESFIVQAPAGSGKTTLLVQRYLALLAKVKYPEEIIAITFTQKAALEMKNRIIEALCHANKTNESAISEPHKLITYSLAKNVLLANQKSQWNLLENPSRFKVQTIDSLCYSITKQLPLLSRFLPDANILDTVTAEKYYDLAVKTILQNFDDSLLDEFYLEKLETILVYLDNDRMRIKNLLIEMINKRDQWLSHFLHLRHLKQGDQIKLRNTLENSLKNIITDAILNFQANFPQVLKSEINELLMFAANNIENKKNTDFDNCSWTNLASLQFMAKTFLTEELQLRKIVNKKQGFPAKNEARNKEEKDLFIQMKTRMNSLLQDLENHPNFCLSLANISNCPPPNYSDQQWAIISSLLELLPLLVAQLKILFTEHKVADFTEVAMAANTALGSNENPTDLALNLDYKIKHLLVDEFQDTSISQYRLLEKLTSSWETNDGRTLFLVGDPMQSIYRFRQAEVSLFLRAQIEGISNIRLLPLTLSLNYRSSKNIIDWLNISFEKILPKNHSPIYGAVTFNRTEAVANEMQNNSAVKLHLLSNATPRDEAQHIVALIKNILCANPTANIAILGRSRAHFIDIIYSLKNEKIKFSAIELETLNNNETIKDLFALTRAIYNLNDNIAWLAILRAPWCGLSLNDLHKIAMINNDEENKTTLFERLCNNNKLLELTPSGLTNIARFLPPIKNAVLNKQKLSLRETIEKVWRQIGGPACVLNENELETADIYFDLLEKLNSQNNFPDLELLANNLEKLFASTDCHDNAKIQIMTIHKAKGLEFDNVFLVAIDREVKNDSKKIILWAERPLRHKQTDFLLAPINAIEYEKEPIYEYLQSIEAKKNYFEIGRLLYVATTRARKNLYLIGKIKTNEKEINSFQKPSKNSFLEQLWPMFSSAWLVSYNSLPIAINTELCNNQIRRLSPNWTHPYENIICSNNMIASVTHLEKIANTSHYTFKLDNELALQLGTVIHKCLQQLCQNYSTHNLSTIANYIEKHSEYWRLLLLEQGLTSQTDQQLTKIISAIQNILTDSRGKWILQNHKDAKNEYEITTVTNNQIEHLIIDRTFIDEQDQRWIIDYKTSMPKESQIEKFIENEFQLYKKQLEKYAAALSKIEHRKIFLGLYFPLIPGWKEWAFG